MNIFLGEKDDVTISDNIGFLNQDKRFRLLNRTIQFEELINITKAHNPEFENELMIDSYNVFGAYEVRFPSNKNHFGAIYQTLAQLHAFKGGVDTMLKWNVIGNSGIFSGGFSSNSFSKNPTYYAWDFITNIAELRDGNSIISCKTQEEALDMDVDHVDTSYKFLTDGEDDINVVDHHVDAYSIQPFAISKQDGGINVVLVNKSREGISRFIKTPDDMSHYEVYKFTENTGVSYEDMIENPHTNSTNLNDEYAIRVYCSPESINVVKFYPNSSRMAINKNSLNDIELDVVNSTLNIKSTNFSKYTVDFYDIKGMHIKTEEINTKFSEIDLSFLDLGIYILKVKNDKNEITTTKISINK